jgi:hypothetical protein
MELVRSSISTDYGLPCVTVRSAPAIVFSGPAQRSLTLWPARSPTRQATLSIEGSDSFVASTAASIATGWSEPVPGRELHPLKSSAFHGALFRQLSEFSSEWESHSPRGDCFRFADDPGVIDWRFERKYRARAHPRRAKDSLISQVRGALARPCATQDGINERISTACPIR